MFCYGDECFFRNNPRWINKIRIFLPYDTLQDLPTKSHSTCSDGSLLSMDSYEDEDSLWPQSRHSSKLSLHEKQPTSDSSFEFESGSTTVPLNHSAAHHRVSVKPKRTHGPPRRKRGQQLSIALPATPEVNEDSSIRSLSPEISRKETLTELYSMNTTRTVLDAQIKCSSLPPGLTAAGAEPSKLNRSKSNAGSKSNEFFSTLLEEKEEKLSLFDRIFPRRSGRKKKKEVKLEAKTAGVFLEKRNDTEIVSTETTDSGSTTVIRSETSAKTYRAEASKPIPAPRSGAATRQRVLPADLPETGDEAQWAAPPVSPPCQVELENRVRQRQISLSTSPTSVPILVESPPLSPRSPKSPRIPRIPETQILPTVISSSSEHTQFVKSSSITTRHIDNKPRSEEFKSRIKMPGLSSLQQRALTLNEDPGSNFKSLTDFAETKSSKPLTKSRSFKETKHSFNSDMKANDINTSTATFLSAERAEESRNAMNKAASLDSIKHLEEEPIHFSELKFELKKSKPDVRVKNDEKPNIFDSLVTISGPSHASIVNITSNKEDFSSSTKSIETAIVDGSHTISIKENQVSVTKIQVEQKSTQLTQSTITVPEFVGKQLHKVEIRPTSNIILSIKSPKLEEPTRPKTLFNFDAESEISGKPPAPRKFSKENLEIVEKDVESPPVKNDGKSSVVSITQESPVKERRVYSRPVSLESDKSSQDDSDKLEDKTVVLRRSKKLEEDPPSSITDNLEIVEKEVTPQSNEFKNKRKSSVVSINQESPVKEKNSCLDSLDSDKSSQDSLDKLEGKPVVLRRKSLASKKRDDEPELMKVFARRSLKLKDSDVEALQDSLSENKTRDSDKENQMDSPIDERKKIFTKTNETSTETDQRKKSVSRKEDSPDVVENVPQKNGGEGSPVLLRRTFNANIFIGQRAFSVNTPKSQPELIVKKQGSFTERRRTDQWMTNMKNEDEGMKDRVESDIIDGISPKGDFITEPKNFSQRKAEWEQRAQLAQKKTSH
ncbi:unnamed protein product [Phaedon cochleariae]|uniref:Uncharacterized protein n=1 Tax=Phaedon cochleariae TaxID=80249 RepID=A0A9P0DJD6_PHACE|nr:unnamed protein product [Phaedon cochleariae]